jgi:hypothetical protein
MHQLQAADDPEISDEFPDDFYYTSMVPPTYFAELLKPS